MAVEDPWGTVIRAVARSTSPSPRSIAFQCSCTPKAAVTGAMRPRRGKRIRHVVLRLSDGGPLTSWAPRVPAESYRDRYRENRTVEIRPNPMYGANGIARYATQRESVGTNENE